MVVMQEAQTRAFAFRGDEVHDKYTVLLSLSATLP